MRTRQKQRIIIGVLCTIVIGLAVGYAVLSQQLNIQGTSGITSDFNIVFTDIQEGTMNGATTVSRQITGSTTATFTIDLKSPGSNGEYLITVENRGTIDAYVESISGIDEANQKEPTDIKFNIEDIKVNDKLKSKESKVFKVKVNWNSNSTSIPHTSKDLTLDINFSQETSLDPNNPVNKLSSKTQDLLDSSTEGTYNYMDGTYLKGEQDSNYVWFDGFLWRIMGKNADGSIRMITEENVTAIPWGAENTAEVYDNSYINDWLNSYFYPKLKDKDILVNQMWCSEATESETSARTTCTNNLSNVQKPVGLISVDEYNLARSKYGFAWDEEGYLNTSSSFRTLTPYDTSITWNVESNGSVDNSSATGNGDVVQLAVGVRPVIGISSDVTITRGNGTLTAPYIIGEVNDVTGSLKDNSYVGEYVTYAGRNYRIVETSNQGTKLILDGYYDSNNDGEIDNNNDTMAYGTADGTCTLCTTINEEFFINWISNNNESDKNKLISTTWYHGDYFERGDNYKTNLESTSNPYEGRVGLIRVGEMLSGQSVMIPQRNYYWTATQSDMDYAWIVYKSGNAYSLYVTAKPTYNNHCVRPVIMISPDVQITSGNGTFNSPYQI